MFFTKNVWVKKRDFVAGAGVSSFVNNFKTIFLVLVIWLVIPMTKLHSQYTILCSSAGCEIEFLIIRLLPTYTDVIL